MCDQVGLHEPRPGVVPVGKGADRDLTLQQAARLGPGPALDLQTFAVAGQAAVDGGRRHRYKPRSPLGFEVQFPATFQGVHHLGQHRLETLAAREDHQHPDHPQGVDDRLVIDRRSRLAGGLTSPLPARDDRPGCHPAQRPAGGVTIPVRQGAQLAQHHHLLLLGRPAVADSHLLGHSLAFCHGKPHTGDVAKRAFLHEETTTPSIRTFYMSQLALLTACQ